MLNERLKELASKYLNDTATEKEIRELHQWYDEWNDNEEIVSVKPPFTEEDIRQRILAKIQSEIDSAKNEESIVHSRRIWYTIAAATIIMGFGFGIFKLLSFSPKPAKIGSNIVNSAPEIPAPKVSRAMITLADGTRVPVDSVTQGILARQGNIKLLKTADGQIVYQGNFSSPEDYNTLVNPRGSQVVSLMLSDGTRVWLNAESSLRYPVSFNGNERKVEVTGEAYFEVTHNTKQPFRVQKGGMQVTVYGTHFNVKAYDDEETIQVTLLEGLVKVKKGNSSGLLKPGEQAKIGSDVKIVDNVDLEEVMAWKSGKFQFGEAADIQTIMKQISRWYDVDIEYKGVINDHIGGTISRNSNASQVLKMLELTGVVTFQVNAKKVIVMPK